MEKFKVLVEIDVKATTYDEAQMMVERYLAGRFDSSIGSTIHFPERAEKLKTRLKSILKHTQGECEHNDTESCNAEIRNLADYR